MVQPSPHRRNRLLAAMTDEDFARLEPHLQAMDMPTALVLYESDAPLDTVYFPHDAVISVVSVMGDGGVAEMATIGREGLAGYSWVNGEERALGRHIVQLPGHGSRMALRPLVAACAKSGSLRDLLLRSTEVLLRETMQLAACNALHSVEARCCRWILTTQDRVGSPHLRLTQEFLSEMLGVQRTTVSLVQRTLESQGLILTSRGRIEVVDRAGLEASACECYAIVNRNLARLLPHAGD